MRAIFRRTTSHFKRTLLAKGIVRVKKDEHPVRWAIAGTGYMANHWADLLTASKSSVLRSVYSRSASSGAAFKEKFGCDNYYTDLDNMLRLQKDDIDIVYVATPIHSHYDIIKKCIEANINVLTEKPATPSAAQWIELCSLAKTKGILLMEGMWMRCLPASLQADTWIESGEIGKISIIRADMNKSISHADFAGKDTGVLLDYGTYAIRFVTHFLGGMPEVIHFAMEREENGRDRDWAIFCKRRDITAVVNISANSNSSSRALVVGTKGVIEWDSPFNRTNKISLRYFGAKSPVHKEFRHTHEGFEYQLEEVVNTLKSGSPESKILSHRSTLETLQFSDLITKE